MNKFPYENYQISISFPCSPDKADTLAEATMEVIKDIQKNGISEDYVNRIKETQKREMEVSIKENGYWLSALQYSTMYDEDPTLIVDYNSRINNLNADDLQKAAKKYFDFKNYAEFVLYPESFKKQSDMR